MAKTASLEGSSNWQLRPASMMPCPSWQRETARLGAFCWRPPFFVRKLVLQQPGGGSSGPDGIPANNHAFVDGNKRVSFAVTMPFFVSMAFSSTLSLSLPTTWLLRPWARVNFVSA